MAIMKKLFTDNGSALIVLIICIVITGLIGAGITSLVASKKASEDYPIYSHQAYLLAHTGIEFAIRYVHDNSQQFTANLPSTSYAFIFQYNSANPCTSASMSTTIWKQINLPDEFTKDNSRAALYISLEGNCASRCILHSCGKFGGAVREVKLNNFQSYY